MSELKLNPSEIVFIGDTLHDFEVACELGFRCILISHGHQSKEILNRSGAKVIDNLSQLKA